MFRPILDSYLVFPIFGLVLLIALWVGTLNLLHGQFAVAQSIARETSKQLSDTYKAQITLNLKVIEQTLKVIQYTYKLQGPNFSLSDMQDRNALPPGFIFKLVLADRSGTIFASTLPYNDTFAIDGEAYFERFQQNPASDMYVSAPLKTRHDKWYIQFCIPLTNVSGGFEGVAIVAVDPTYFTIGYDSTRLGQVGALAVIGADNVVRIRRTGDDTRWGDVVDPAWIAPLNGNRIDGALLRTPWDGVVRYTTLRKLPNLPLYVMAGLSQEEELGPWQTDRKNYLVKASMATAGLIMLIAILTTLSRQLHKSRQWHQKAQETYYAASEASPDGFFVMRSVFDSQHAIVDFIIEDTNKRGAILLGFVKQNLVGRSLLKTFPLTRHNGIFEEMKVVVQNGHAQEVEWNISKPGDPPKWLRRQMVRVNNGVVIVLHDITERKQTEDRILHMAHHDALTGLPNRTLLNDRIERAILSAHRYGHRVTIVFIDIDNFKPINDTLGHDAGDLVLKTLSQRMLKCVRKSDTVIRLGGDEFVIILGNQSEHNEQISSALLTLHKTIGEPLTFGNRSYELTCSMGIAIYPVDGTDVETLLRNADAAMYRAKELGRNNHQFYTSTMNSRAEHRLEMLNDLKVALKHDHFKLVYQPQLDLLTGAITGAEALLRWHHPERGIVSPLDFIPLAEESGLIVAIGRWVLRTACFQNKIWQDAGLPPITVSVNVSARQFREKDLISDVANALTDSGLEPHYLELEITESVIVQDQREAVATMHRLKNMGVSLSIDDFGTGFSSLNFLKTFPVVRLKIDKSFVDGIPANQNDNAIALAVIALGHAMDLNVIAEGVETVDQRTFLRDNQCDAMQGYLFSKPVSPGYIEELLATHSANAHAIDMATVSSG